MTRYYYDTNGDIRHIARHWSGVIAPSYDLDYVDLDTELDIEQYRIDPDTQQPVPRNPG